MIADDHSIVRNGLRKILEANEIEVIGEAANGQEAIELAIKLQPDVVLMDIGMPDEDGITATRKIKSENPEINVVMLTMHSYDEILVQAIRAGAIGYVLKERSPEELIYSVRAACKGESVVSPSLAKRLLFEFQEDKKILQKAKELPLTKLTKRELQVLRLISKGKTNKEIAKELFISDNTVKNHLSNIFKKLHTSDRTKAAIVALKKGLIS